MERFSEEEVNEIKSFVQDVIEDIKFFPGVNLVQVQAIDKESFLKGVEGFKKLLEEEEDEEERMLAVGGNGHIFVFANPDKYKDLIFILQVDYRNEVVEAQSVANIAEFMLRLEIRRINGQKGR